MSGVLSGEGRRGGLDTLTQEELVAKCKSLLSLAQKAKHAKDDLAKKFEVLKEEDEKLKVQQTERGVEQEQLKTKVHELESQAEDLDDLLKAKQRKVDRLVGENDGLLQQLETYSQETRLSRDTLVAKEKVINDLTAKSSSLEKKAGKCMELEAYVICAKETEKKLKEDNKRLEAKIKDQDEKLKGFEESLKMEKKLCLDKNQQIKSLSDKIGKLETMQEKSSDETNNKESEQIENMLGEIKNLKICIDELETKSKSQIDELESLKQEKSGLEIKFEEISSKVGFVVNEKNVLESTNEGLISELNELNTEIKKRGEKIGRMEQTLMELNSQQQSENSDALDKALADLAEIKDKLNLAERENEELTKSVDTLNTRSNELESENKDQDGMIKSQTKEIDSLDFELTSCQEKIAGYKEKVVKLETQHEQTILERNKHLNKLESDLKESNSKIEELREILENANQEVDSLKSGIVAKETESSNYRDELIKLADQQSEAEGAAKELNATREALADVSRKLEEQEIKVKDLQALKESKETEEITSKEIITITISQLEKEKEDLEGDVKKLKAELFDSKTTDVQSDLSQELMKLSAEKEEMQQEKKIFQNKLAGLETEMESLSKELDSSKQTAAESRELIEILKKEIDISRSESASGKQTEQAFEKELESKSAELQDLSMTIEQLKSSMKTKEEEFESVQINMTDLAKQAQLKANECDDINSKFSQLKTLFKSKSDDLETCSKLKTEFETELLSKTENLTSLTLVAQNLQLEVEKKSKELETSAKRISSLNREIENIKSLNTSSSLNNSNSLNQSSSSVAENDDSRSEIMSTSTVSRADEVNRMRDIEDSFEDRYARLRLVAIKLKKKVGDQAKVISELEKAKTGLTGGTPAAAANSAETAGLKDKVATFSKNFANLQSEYDQAVDKIDALEKTVKALTRDLETTMTESINNKQSALDSGSSLGSLKGELSRLQESLKVRETELTSVNVTLDQERKERKCLETKIKEAEVRDNQLKGKRSELMLAEESISSLRQQVVELEETLEKEQERGNRAQASLTSTRDHLNKVETDLMRGSAEVQDLKSKLEEAQSSLEQTKEELSEVLSRTEKSGGEERNKVSSLERQLNAMENRMQNKIAECREREEELERLKKEFESYKVRAQSVLKQAKDNVNQEDRTKKKDEILAMEKMNDALQDKIRSLSLMLKTGELEKRGLQEEHDRLMERQSLLLQELAGKEKSWRSRLEEMEKKERSLEAELGKGAETLAQETEVLNQKLNQELELARTTHNVEMGRLKTQIDVAENEIIRLEFMLQKEQEARKQAEENGGSLPHMERERIDISQMEREAAEGQEVEPGPGAFHTSPLPLEQLLALTEQPVHPDRQGSGSRQSDRTQASSRQGGADRQVANLSVLLSESEAQNARLEKLAEALKEEIRIYQRSEERHKHIENLEYVKNIILKFVTLQGEERGRLVPVLQTILKLSKDEVAMVQQVAKVEEESGNAGEGWGWGLGLGWSNP